MQEENSQRENAFAKDIDAVINLLLMNKHVAVCGMHKSGATNVVKLVAKRFAAQYPECNLVIEPDYTKLPLDYQQKLYHRLSNSQEQIYTIIGIEVSTFLNLEKEFETSTKLIRSIYLLPNRDKISANMLLEEMNPALSGKQKELIYDWAGGVVGLMRRCVDFYNEHNKLILKSIINEPSTQINLNKLAKEYMQIDEALREKFGITKNGQLKSQLLKKFIELKFNTKPSLPQALLQHLLNKRGELVRYSEIDELILNESSETNWSVYKNIQRVKELLPKQYKLRNVYGKGYILVSAV